MTIRLSVAVQHHPSRVALLPPLLEHLAGLDVEVVEDPDPNGIPSPWRCYEQCLRTTPDWCTHRLVVQDDAVPCDGFAEAVVAALEARPDRPVAFFVGGYPPDACKAMGAAAREGRSWVDLSPWSGAFPCVASAWPAELAHRLLDWVEAHPGKVTRADDAVTQRFFQAERVWPLATVPSLVEHPDVELSIIGRRAWAGRDKGRVACVPTGAADARSIVW